MQQLLLPPLLPGAQLALIVIIVSTILLASEIFPILLFPLVFILLTLFRHIIPLRRRPVGITSRTPLHTLKQRQYHRMQLIKPRQSSLSMKNTVKISEKCS